MPELENPFQETLLSRHRAEPCTVVIFGATGDLTNRKLIPAFYNIAACGDLPPQFKVVGFARRDKADEGFRAELEEGNRKNSRQGHNDELWKSFAQCIHYHRSEFEDLEGYKALKPSARSVRCRTRCACEPPCSTSRQRPRHSNRSWR
jgi:glucose-6-phosphate 1-dehydrogenase